MSYEGYQQNLCANGHSYENDGCSDFELYLSGVDRENDPKQAGCPLPNCQAPCVWWNLVDTTNGSFNVDSSGNETAERIDGYVELEELTPAEVCTCSGCGNNHIKKQATYKVPENVGHRI